MPLKPLCLYKERVSGAFHRAASTYDAHASVQKKAARVLFDFARPYLREVPHSLLEVGCGTGFLSKYLVDQWPQTPITLVDMAPAMLALCQKNMGVASCRYLLGDGERDVFAGAPFEAIFSNLTFQWFHNLSEGIANLWNQTETLVFSVLLKGSFAAWRQAGVACDPYPTEEALQALCGRQRQARVHFYFSEEWEFYETPLAWMQHLHYIGAHSTAAAQPPRSLHTFIKRFSQGISINYRLAYCVMERS